MKLLLVKILDKFKYAIQGLMDGLCKDKSIQIQWFFAICVFIISFLFPLTKGEWITILSLCFMVLACEYINSAIEALVDLASPEYHPLAKKCKDYAAASVLLISIVAAIIGLMIYIPYLLEMIGGIL